MDSIDSNQWNTSALFIIDFTNRFAAEGTNQVIIWNNMKITAYHISVSRFFKLETRNKAHQMS